MHAAIDFCFQHSEIAQSWHTQSNYIAALSVKNEEELLKLISKLESRGHCYTVFREPDLENEITAIAIEYREDLKKLTGGLPLLLKPGLLV